MSQMAVQSAMYDSPPSQPAESAQHTSYSGFDNRSVSLESAGLGYQLSAAEPDANDTVFAAMRESGIYQPESSFLKDLEEPLPTNFDATSYNPSDVYQPARVTVKAPPVVADDMDDEFAHLASSPHISATSHDSEDDEEQTEKPDNSSFLGSFLSFIRGVKGETLSSVTNSDLKKKPDLPKYIPDPRPPRRIIQDPTHECSSDSSTFNPATEQQDLEENMDVKQTVANVVSELQDIYDKNTKPVVDSQLSNMQAVGKFKKVKKKSANHEWGDNAMIEGEDADGRAAAELEPVVERRPLSARQNKGNKGKKSEYMY